MAPFSVNVKHAGKTYTLDLDPDLPAKAFKEAVYQATGVPVDRMKVMVKGGMLKVCVFLVRLRCCPAAARCPGRVAYL